MKNFLTILLLALAATARGAVLYNQLPTTNRVAGTNLVVIWTGPHTNGLKAITESDYETGLYSLFATTGTKQIDSTIARLWVQTNRLAAAATFNLTNLAAGHVVALTVPGEVSGGTDRAITLTWPSGWFASYGSIVTNGASTVTVTNGQVIEMNISCGVLDGTNTARVVMGRFSR